MWAGKILALFHPLPSDLNPPSERRAMGKSPSEIFCAMVSPVASSTEKMPIIAEIRWHLVLLKYKR